MISKIPVPPNLDAFSLLVELDESVYQLDFRWNARDEHWFMNISFDDVIAVLGIKLVVVDDLLAYARRLEGLPPGRLFVEDLDGLDRDPDGVLFGTRVELRYEDVDA